MTDRWEPFVAELRQAAGDLSPDWTWGTGRGQGFGFEDAVRCQLVNDSSRIVVRVWLLGDGTSIREVRLEMEVGDSLSAVGDLTGEGPSVVAELVKQLCLGQYEERRGELRLRAGRRRAVLEISSPNRARP